MTKLTQNLSDIKERITRKLNSQLSVIGETEAAIELVKSDETLLRVYEKQHIRQAAAIEETRAQLTAVEKLIAQAKTKK